MATDWMRLPPVIAVALLTSASAWAAPVAPSRETARIAVEPSVQQASAEADAGDGLNCSKTRKRLWVESEGWVVRKVTICH